MILSSLLFLLLCSASRVDKPFDPEAFLAGNKLRYACNVHCYEALDTSVTPAPNGYKAFYFSNISRHGSRGYYKDDEYRYLDTLYRYDSMGLLTAEAKCLLKSLTDVKNRNYAEGLGELTTLGAKEQSNIGRRAAEHYPEIFSNPECPNVSCYHTTTPRVVASMDNFVASISSRYPQLTFRRANHKASTHARHEVKVIQFSKEQMNDLSKIKLSPFMDSLMRSTDSTRLLRKTFVNGKMPEQHKGLAMRFFYDVYKLGRCRQCFDTDTLDWVENYYTDEELALFSKWCNAKQFTMWGWTSENKGHRSHNARRILHHIIEDADAVIAGADTCATLRFTHDVDVLPLMCLIGVKGAEWHGSFKHVYEHCQMSYLIHMAGNLQFVFYRNSKNDILVKILLNEEETIIPALKPDYKGVFYKWSRLKKYFELLTKK